MNKPLSIIGQKRIFLRWWRTDECAFFLIHDELKASELAAKWTQEKGRRNYRYIVIDYFNLPKRFQVKGYGE